MKVIVTDEISEKGLELLQNDPRIQLDVLLGLSKTELHEIIGGYEAIITRSGTQVDAELLNHAGKLKMIARAGVGIDNVDVPAASERGIIVVNAPFGNTNSAAEHSMALLLSMCRNVPDANASLKSGQWQRAPFTGCELKQKAMGMYMSKGFGTTADMKEKGVYAITAKVVVGDVKLMDSFEYEIK
jgi:D-3-phosphoglycerate dehydrogenase